MTIIFWAQVATKAEREVIRIPQITDYLSMFSTPTDNALNLNISFYVGTHLQPYFYIHLIMWLVMEN